MNGSEFFVGAYLSYPHIIVVSIIPNKMVAKLHGFLVQVSTRVSSVQHHTHVVQKIGVGLDTLISIYLGWYWSIRDSLTEFFTVVNLELNF